MIELPNKFNVKLEAPSVDDFLLLRSQVGWDGLETFLAEASLNNSLFHVTIWLDSQLIGMARVVGDDAMYFYIQDLIVHPDYQKLGIGKVLMKKVEEYLFESAKKGATIGLLAAQGKESFYAHYGYTKRPNNKLGHGMCKFV